jgi:opacity protein-like surface antigen
MCTSSIQAQPQGQRFDWVQRFQWMETLDLYRPNVSAVVGGTNSCSNMITKGGADTVDGTGRSICDGGFVGGVKLEMNLFHVPNVLDALGITKALGGTRPKTTAAIGGQFFALGSSAQNTFYGSQITNLGSAPATDRYTVEKDWILGFAAMWAAPVCQNVNFVAHVGYAWVNNTIGYECNGTCTNAAGIPARSFSESIWTGGWTVGAGVEFVVPGVPFIVGLDYTHIALNERTYQFGNPAEVQLGFRVGQDIDMITLGAKVSFGSLVGGQNF